jgi:hypothetical protein
MEKAIARACGGASHADYAMIRRRSAIEPAIGEMKTDENLDRNRSKGALGDAIHAVLCSVGRKPEDDPAKAAASFCLRSCVLL